MRTDVPALCKFETTKRTLTSKSNCRTAETFSSVALFLVSSNKLTANMDSAVAMVKDKLAGLRSKLDQIPILQQAEVS